MWGIGSAIAVLGAWVSVLSHTWRSHLVMLVIIGIPLGLFFGTSDDSCATTFFRVWMPIWIAGSATGIIQCVRFAMTEDDPGHVTTAAAPDV
jgi:hypothetical protein